MTSTKFYSWLATLLIVFLLLMSIRPGQVLACSCAYDPTLTEAERVVENFQRAHNEIVFVGKVADAELHLQDAVGQPIENAAFITFMVETVYKGTVGPQFTLGTATSDSACGYNFVRGETYLVFVGDMFKDGSWDSGLCSGNQLNPSAALLSGLGEGAPPTETGERGEVWPGDEAVAPLGLSPSPYSWLLPTAVLLLATAVILRTYNRARKAPREQEIP